MLRALNYMHLNHLVHRDIKADNVVYSSSPENENTAKNGGPIDISKLEVKLIDFGFSRISVFGESKLRDFVGTPYYIAPEIINNKPYGFKCDIWSLGVLVYQLISGSFPFTG